MNHVTLLGRLSKDPEITTNGEMKVAKYSLAVRRNFKSSQNVDWINCTCFGRLADNAEKYLKKGMLIAASGRIQTGSYVNKEGKKVYTTDVVIAEQEFAESKKAFEDRVAQERAGDASPGPESAAVEPPKVAAPDDWMNVPEGFDENDIPFA